MQFHEAKNCLGNTGRFSLSAVLWLFGLHLADVQLMLHFQLLPALGSALSS